MGGWVTGCGMRRNESNTARELRPDRQTNEGFSWGGVDAVEDLLQSS